MLFEWMYSLWYQQQQEYGKHFSQAFKHNAFLFSCPN